MKTIASLLSAALLAAPASAQTWAQRAAGLTGARLAGFEAPVLGQAGVLPPVQTASRSGAEKGALADNASGFAARIKKLDRDLDKAYDAWRRSLADKDKAAVEALLNERAYYDRVWRAITEPVKDLPKSDARVSEVLEALYGYLQPLPGRVERLTKARDAAAAAVAKARDEADGAVARLHLDDRKAVEELGLIEGDWDKVLAAVPDERKSSEQYKGWLKEAFDKNAAWAKSMKVFNVAAEQHAFASEDYARNAALAKALTEKKLGSAQPAAK